MLGFVWLTLRQAQEALKNGRLEEAHRLLDQPSTRGHRRTGSLLVGLAKAYVERGERQLRLDDAEGAWRDLLQAEGLSTAEKSCDRLRQTLTGLGIAEVRALLQAGETSRADEAVARMRQRGVRTSEIQILEEGLKGWLQARTQADQGEFAPAHDQVERARRLLGPTPRLEIFREELFRRQATFAGLLGRLHEAANGEKWRSVIETAELVLAAAPQHAEAKALRSRAWKAVAPETVAMSSPNGETERINDLLAPRFFLWIDGVGGYLICLGSRLTFGKATPEARADVPLVADVSRLHATLTRDGEGYLLEAVRPIHVNAKPVTRVLLRPGDRVTLGATCQFQFQVPLPSSMTARLDLVSGHKLPLAVDAVLLMADTLVMDKGPKAHVTVAGLKGPIILFRNKDGLGVRHAGELWVDGVKSPGRTLLAPQARLMGNDVVFAIEPAS
jgi:hypothetical protein